MDHRNMTVVEASVYILNQCSQPMTSREIYEKIIDLSLYTFNAQNPKAIVNSAIRRHCFGLDFTTASPKKYFELVRDQKKDKYIIYEPSKSRPLPSGTSNAQELLPEEKMDQAHKEHIKLIQMQLMNAILNADPSFFEGMVLDLLLKMGYGYDAQAGIVTGAPNDGGVDAIIEEDKLGLDQIYIQAKRYALNHPVPKEQIRSFIGTLTLKSISKGVFITTSSISKGAKSEIIEKGINCKLIDGEALAELLIKYEVGVSSKRTMKTYSLDDSYFPET